MKNFWEKIKSIAKKLGSFFAKIGGFIKKIFYAPAKSDRLAKKVEIKGAKYFFKGLVWVLALAFPAFCYVITEYIHFASISQGRLVHFLQTRTAVAVAMLGLTYLIWTVLLLIFRKVAIANGILAGVYVVSVVTNHFKYTLTGDFFYPWDLVQSGNLGELSSFLSQGFPWKFVLAIAVLVTLAMIPALTNASLPLRFYLRIPAGVLIAAMMLLSVNTPQKVEEYLVKNTMGRDQAALQQSNYIDNGFIGGFTINLLSMQVEVPEGYSEDAVSTVLDKYDPIPAREDYADPDVIVILSESFWDPKDLPGSTFTDLEGNEIDPIANFEEISSRPGAISGLMANTALGGGTVRPEFEVLTGLSTDYLPSGSIPYQYLEGATDSYPMVYKNMGYTTYSVHPYIPAFYSRDTGYPLIGIDNLNFENEVARFRYERKGGYLSDNLFSDFMIDLLENGEGENKFVMGISMEAHQPYETKYKPEQLEIVTANPNLAENALKPFRNFTMAMYDADQALGKLVDYIDSREKETVLIYFGDHLPTLGANYAAYIQSGLINSTQRLTRAERYATQCTPFLIYSNYELGESSLVHEGKDNEIASYNLLNAAAELIGAPRSEYHQWLEEFGLAFPTYNNRMLIPVNEELQKFINTHRMMTYDRVAGENYSKGR